MIALLFVIIAISGFVFYSKYKKEQTEKFVDNVVCAFRSMFGFNPDYYQIMAKKSGAIGLDVNKKMICIVNSSLKPYYFTRNDILKSEIMIDDETYLQKDFFKTWGKYFLLRSIGDNSIAETAVEISKEKYVKKINTIQLRISTRDFDKPNHYLLFLKFGNDRDKRMMMNDIYDWISRIESL